MATRSICGVLLLWIKSTFEVWDWCGFCDRFPGAVWSRPPSLADFGGVRNVPSWLILVIADEDHYPEKAPVRLGSDPLEPVGSYSVYLILVRPVRFFSCCCNDFD
ncbi:hypothetical protein LINPERPRIM_LOCUS2235 [Linum perenne]